jgi:hypothetical protein
VLVAALVGPAGALAHGDPTAHYLETDPLLTSYAAPPDLQVELKLRGVLDAATARGYPIKVVLFSSEEDTGGDPAPVEDPQDYVPTVTDQLESTAPLRAPVLIVTPHAYGLAGRQPRAGKLVPITPQFAHRLAHGLPLAKKAQGTALARAAMTSIRRLAAAGGHPLPKHIPPAKQNLNGILGSAAAGGGSGLGPGLIALMLLGTVLVAGLLVAAHRRVSRQPEPHT